MILCDFLLYICSVLNNLIHSNNCINQKTPRNEQGNSTGHKLKLDDLNFDVLFLICDEFLEFGDLVNLADTNSKLSYFAAEIFRIKFRNNHFSIEPDKYPGSKVFKETIRIHDYELIVTALKHFGKNVQKIDIDCFYLKPKQSAGIIGAIYKYCSQTLIEFNFFWVDFDIWNHFTRPFPNVKLLKMGLRRKDAEPTEKLHKIFPNIEQFILKIEPTIGDSFTDCFLPHLKHVTLRIEYTIYSKSNGEFKGEQLLQINPQIKSIGLDLQYSPVDILNKVNQLLPNLEHLLLHQCPTYADVHFKTVRALTIDGDYFRGFEHIKFSQLQEVKLDYYIYLHDETHAFLKENSKTLRQLDIKERINSDDFQLNFESILKELPNLTQILVMCTQRLNFDVLERILNLDYQKNLQNFTCSNDCFSNSDSEDLLQNIRSEWTVNIDNKENSDKPKLEFVRNN